MKRVLLVTAAFPPQLGGASEKMGSRARYLGRCGWQTVVLAPEIPADAPRDETLVEGLGAVEVHRTPYLLQERMPSLRHDRGRAVDLGGGSVGRTLDLFFVPRGYVRWLPHAWAAGRRLAQSVDALLSVNNPVTLHVLGYLLQRSSGRPWVAEIRDPIVHYAYGRRGPERLNHWLERLVVTRADAVIQRLDGSPDLVRPRYPRIPASKFTEIPYAGFDPADFAGYPDDPPRDETALTISYTGNFYGETITPEPFLRGLRAVLDRRPESARAVRARFAGGWSPAYDALVADLGLDSVVEHLGWLSRGACLQLWGQSHALLLILGKEADNPRRIPSKFWDYLGARRPILALVHPEGRLADLIAEHDLGRVADPYDVDAIAGALEATFDDHRNGRPALDPDPHFLAAASRAESERAVARVLDGVTGKNTHAT